MPSFTRRSFLKTSALAAGAAWSARSRASIAGANGDVRLAVCGLNGRGQNHLSSLARIPGVRVAALCDPDSAVLARSVQKVGSGVKAYADIRALLASPEIDAVTIATPNHWHSLAAIWACQAGKDVYVEKPVSHNVWEGRQLVTAAARYHRVVQVGTQIRSGAGLQEAVAWVQAGHLGKITASRGLCYKLRPSIGRTVGPQPIPATVNYDLWSGPVAVEPLRRRHLHYDWHWHFATGNGDVGNQGVHQMDVARWFLGESGLPRHSWSVGGRLGYVDDGDTPNTQVIVHDYATAPLIFEVRGLPARKGASAMDQFRGASIGNVVECEGGCVVTAEYFSATAYDRAGQVIRRFQGEDRHMANFVEIVRSRRTAGLFGPVREGHVSSALCHLGNLSHQLGQAAGPGEMGERIRGQAALAEAVGRMTEHLAANGVDLRATPATWGEPLAISPGEERFLGNDRANGLLRPAYRPPYTVPDLG